MQKESPRTFPGANLKTLTKIYGLNQNHNLLRSSRWKGFFNDRANS